MKTIYNASLMFFLTYGLSAQEKPLNILCLVCEDISPFIGCYGDPVAVTPNIDRLATEGVRFTNFCTSMGVSAPSRASLITGMYPSAIGANQMRNQGQKKFMPNGIVPYDVVLADGVKCYPEFLRASGYYCTNNAKTDYQFAPPLTAWDENGKNAHWKNAPRDKPFFSIFNFEVTHESQIWKRANEPMTIDPNKVNVPPYYPDDAVVRKDIARMYSNITVMDSLVQEKIDELKQAGLLENTIIIFYSDNGGPLPRGKREVYNSGLQVPLIIRYPHKKNAGTIDDQLCSFVDIPASILSLAQLKAPQYMHGKSFLGKYKSLPREYIYGAKDRCDEAIDKIGTIRDKKYQYIRNYMPETSGYNDIKFRMEMPMMRDILAKKDAGLLNKNQMKWFMDPRPAEEFYDLKNDPHEMNNLISDSRYSVEIKRLRSSYNQWIRDYNENWFLTELEMRNFMIPDGIQKEVSMPVINKMEEMYEIRCNTQGSSIAYRINGKGDNSNNWLLYTSPISVKEGDIIEATACRIGYAQSIIAKRVIE